MWKYQKCSLGVEIHWYWFTEPRDLHMYRDARKGAEKEETDKGFIPSDILFFFFLTSDQTAALSQAEEANECQELNVTANVASQEVASVSEGISTTRER